MRVTLKMRIEVEVLVEADVTPITEAVTTGHPDRRAPAEGGEVDVISVRLDQPGEHIALPDRVLSGYEEELEEAGRLALEDAEEDAESARIDAEIDAAEMRAEMEERYG